MSNWRCALIHLNRGSSALTLPISSSPTRRVPSRWLTLEPAEAGAGWARSCPSPLCLEERQSIHHVPRPTTHRRCSRYAGRRPPVCSPLAERPNTGRPERATRRWGRARGVHARVRNLAGRQRTRDRRRPRHYVERVVSGVGGARSQIHAGGVAPARTLSVGPGGRRRGRRGEWLEAASRVLARFSAIESSWAARATAADIPTYIPSALCVPLAR